MPFVTISFHFHPMLPWIFFFQPMYSSKVPWMKFMPRAIRFGLQKSKWSLDGNNGPLEVFSSEMVVLFKHDFLFNRFISSLSLQGHANLHWDFPSLYPHHSKSVRKDRLRENDWPKLTLKITMVSPNLVHYFSIDSHHTLVLYLFGLPMDPI